MLPPRAGGHRRIRNRFPRLSCRTAPGLQRSPRRLASSVWMSWQRGRNAPSGVVPVAPRLWFAPGLPPLEAGAFCGAREGAARTSRPAACTSRSDADCALGDRVDQSLRRSMRALPALAPARGRLPDWLMRSSGATRLVRKPAPRPSVGDDGSSLAVEHPHPSTRPLLQSSGTLLVGKSTAPDFPARSGPSLGGLCLDPLDHHVLAEIGEFAFSVGQFELAAIEPDGGLRVGTNRH